MRHSELLSRITARPDVFGGKPIVREMRISVELILSLLAQGVTPEAILEDYPELEPDDIRACTAYAHAGYRQRYAVRRIDRGIVKFLVDRCVGRHLAKWLRGLIAEVLERHRHALETQAVVTIRGGRIRISHPSSRNRRSSASQTPEKQSRPD